jgi:hypothetical protein
MFDYRKAKHGGTEKEILAYEKKGRESYKKSAKSKALDKAKHGLETPKHKWGTKQGNWHKVMPGDRE